MSLRDRPGEVGVFPHPTPNRWSAGTRGLTTIERASVLWSGGGSVGSTTRLRRARQRVRTLVSERPSVYLPIARRRYPGPSPKVIGPGTEAVIDGYTRSASTFAVYAFQLAQPEPVHLAHHLHAPAQLIEAARRGLPTVMLIREPQGALLSQLIREPWVDLLDALHAYRRFHEALLPYRESYVVADFNQVTHDFGSVVRCMNDRFGTSFGIFGRTDNELSECMQMVKQRPRSPILLDFESGEVTIQEARAHMAGLTSPPDDDAETALSRPVSALARRQTTDAWVPSVGDQAKAALSGLWTNPRLAASRSAAEEVYRVFTDHAEKSTAHG